MYIHLVLPLCKKKFGQNLYQTLALNIKHLPDLNILKIQLL